VFANCIRSCRATIAHGAERDHSAATGKATALRWNGIAALDHHIRIRASTRGQSIVSQRQRAIAGSNQSRSARQLDGQASDHGQSRGPTRRPPSIDFVYGNALALTNRQEGRLIYMGTDDGLVQVRRTAAKLAQARQVPGVPDNLRYPLLASSTRRSRVSSLTIIRWRLRAVPAQEQRPGDWTASPATCRALVMAIAEDSQIRICCSRQEFGLYLRATAAEVDRLKIGLPTIAVKDLAIQNR